MGTDNIFDDVSQIYHQEFDAPLQEFNSKQKRSARIIHNYFQKVSENNKQDLAVECIIQIGDKDFWGTIPKENWNQ
ncbi:MAG: hypothetical protein ACK5KP_04585, partial [Paludibacteraceae bacterium]